MNNGDATSVRTSRVSFSGKRALIVVLIAIACGMVSDRLRDARVLFPRPVKVQFTTIPGTP